MLKLRELACKRDERTLFAPLSETVAAGECVALIGANGSGKTTLLRTLAGIHSQYEGSFQCDPFLYQGHRIALDELLNPVENLRWFGALDGRTVSDEDLRQALTRVEMLSYALTPCRRMSQGQQRRITMARWLLSARKLWFLDEPLTALDRQGQTVLNELIATHIEAGGAVFCATHAPLEVAAREISLAPVSGAS